MIKTIVNKLLDREECDGVYGDAIIFKVANYDIEMWEGSDFINIEINKQNEFNKAFDVKFETNLELIHAKYRFEYLHNKYTHNVVNELYKEVIVKEISTFDQAQSEIIDNNVEE